MSNSISTGEQNTANLELIANKDASNGYVGLSLHKINFKNVANTFTSFFTNSNAASRIYTFPDRDLTVAGVDEILPVAGWTSLGICTFETADSPTFQFSIASDVTGVIGVGFRIKLTQTTVKYFIVTAVSAYSGGKTIITVFGGADYALANAAISSPYYSNVKFPFGFPADITKWTWSASYNTNYSKTAASGVVVNTVYNLLSVLSMPVGSWRTCLSIPVFWATNTSASAASVAINVGLSNANNTFSSSKLTFRAQSNNEPAGNTIVYSCYAEETITVASKSSMYVNVMTNAVTTNDMTVAGSARPFSVEYICWYF